MIARASLATLLVGAWLGAHGAVAQTAPPSAPTAQPEVDLKLFDRADVDRSKGCTVALWQSNRDPNQDKFAYLFVEQLTGSNNARQPARIRIGNQPVTFQRVAAGGKGSGYGLFEYQLYKGAGPDEFLILELKLGPTEGEAVAIESGIVSVVLKGKQVFRAAVKGSAGCATPAAQPQKNVATPPAAPAKGPAMFDRYMVRPNLVPAEIINAAQKRFGCVPELMRTDVVGFALSEESAIWEMTCERFAYQASSVYALVHAQMPGKEFRFLDIKAPQGKPRPPGSGVLISPEWHLPSRTVTSVALGRVEGDCGIFERHKVTESGEFALIEYREKKACDGKGTRPQTWPLVFKAN